MTKIIKNRIIFDHEDWLAGDDKFRPNSGVYDKIGNGIYSSSNVSTTRFLDYITAGYRRTAVDNADKIVAYLRKNVIYPNQSNNCFAIENGAQIHYIDDFDSGDILDNTDFPKTVSGGNDLVLDDIEIYFSLSDDKVFYSYNDSIGWNVGIMAPTTPYTKDDDFLTTIPTNPLADNYLSDNNADYITSGKGYHHPLHRGMDDVLYIGSGRHLHAYDGKANVFYGAVLTLPKGYIITGICDDDNGYLHILSYYNVGSSSGDSGKVIDWYWNPNDLDPTQKYNLFDFVSGDIFQWNGTVACFTKGQTTGASSGYTKLQYLNPASGQFEPLITMSGELPIRGGSQVNCKDIYFNSGGDIYLYSYINKLKSYNLCKIADIANGTSGMMSVIGSTASILISSGAGESGGLMNLAAFGAGSVYTKTVSIEFPTGQKARIKSISVLFRNKVAGTSGLSFRVDTSLDGGSLVQATPEISAITKLKYIYYKNNNGTALGDFNTLSLCLQWRESTGTSTAPIIDKIEVDFEPISL